MRDRHLTSVALLAAPVAGLASAALWRPSLTGFAAVVGFYVAAHLTAVPTPSGRHLSFVPGVAGVVAILTDGSPVMALGAAAVALPFGWLAVQWRYGRRAVDDVFPAQVAGLMAFGMIVAVGSTVMEGPAAREPAALAVYAIAAAAWFAVAGVTRGLASEQGRFTARRLVVARGLDDWQAYTILFSSAALLSLTVDVMGAWSLVVAGLPYGFGHASLSRLQATDRTYRETMVALSRIPEAGGHVPPGHAERCAALAVIVGAELAMSATDLERLEYAALLHDIGKVVLANPAIATAGYEPSDVSTWSSVIIAEARHLEPVADIVASQHQPYRRPGESRDESMPRGSQVLRVVAAYDGEIVNGTSPTESLERLHIGAAYDYAPEVVAALRKVLQRQGTIAG